MTYLAITQGTADWLQGKLGLVDAVHDVVVTKGSELRLLETTEFAEGPVRVAASPGREVIAIWNTDYLAGSGEETWGFILIDSVGGILGVPDISREVFERCLYIINQRLQKLMIDGAYIHRSHGNGAHTLLAGRGSKARKYTIAYFEQMIGGAEAPRSSVLCVGPDNDPKFTRITQKAAKEGAKLPRMVTLANVLALSPHSRRAVGQDVLRHFRDALAPYTRTAVDEDFGTIEVATTAQIDPYRSQGLTYRNWTSPEGPLTDTQRRILDSDVLDRHPLRIVGPGGSGKTLLMQLLAVKLFLSAQINNKPIRILYVVHNSAMQQKVLQKFHLLCGDIAASDVKSDQYIEVTTLSEYARTQLDLPFLEVINTDAQEAKQFQFEEVSKAIRVCIEERQDLVTQSKLLTEIKRNAVLEQVFSVLVMAEISRAIKGQGLEKDQKRYIESEQKLSMLHGALSAGEREFVYEVFTHYHKAVFETHEVLDTDDIAITLLARLRTPLWQLKRKSVGFDYVFVDETQLFNDNERRLLPLLTKDTTAHVPIALALDEAQQLYSQRSAGLATLGIKGITNESLPSIHRSTRAIVKLAFFVVQRCTDLFSADFPDFTKIADEMAPETHPLAVPPRFESAPKGGLIGTANAVVERIINLRKERVRQVAVICHADQYWEPLREKLRDPDVGRAMGLPLYVVEERGEKLPWDQPSLTLARPAHIGGQEFDAVILVGLEQGIVPPRVAGNDALASAVEQQALREMYLAITRARFRLIVMLSHRASPTGVLQEAAKAGLIGAR